MFAPDLLAGRRVVLAGAGERPAGERVAGGLAGGLRELGAEVHPLGAGVRDDDETLAAWCARRAPLHAVLVDLRGGAGADDPGSSSGEAGAGDEAAAVTAGLEHAWRAVRAIAVHALIPAGEGGRILLVAPALARASGALGVTPGLGNRALTAGLENLARTLSVEWARFAISAVCIATGESTGDAEVVALVAFALSDAGGYLSGCRFSLGQTPVSPPPPAVRR